MNSLALTGQSQTRWVGIWIGNPQGNHSSHLDYSVTEKITFLVVFIRFLQHILEASPVSQIKIIQGPIERLFSVLCLHIYFFFLWKCTALCNEWHSTDTRLAQSDFTDLLVFHKNRGVYRLKVTLKNHLLQATVVVSVLLNLGISVKSSCWKTHFENINFQELSIKFCVLCPLHVCFGLG